MPAVSASHAFFFDRIGRVRTVDTLLDPSPLVRTDLSEEIHNIVQQAIERVPERRQQDGWVFAKMLRTKFGKVPAEKKRHWDRRLLAAVAFAARITIIMILISALLG